MNDLERLRKKRARLINKSIETCDEFIKIQQELNELDVQIMIEENQDHIPHID